MGALIIRKGFGVGMLYTRTTLEAFPLNPKLYSEILVALPSIKSRHITIELIGVIIVIMRAYEPSL